MKEQWRYRCPNKHTSWQRRHTYGNPNTAGPTPKQEFYCEHCGPFEELVDMKEQTAD